MGDRKMKDEEMAEQFADNISGLELTCSLLSAKDKSHAYRLGRYDGFLAGLKAGRPQWHILAEEPDVLPEDTYDVLDQAGYKVHYNFFQNVWMNEKDEIDEHVIAWCEIPTFDKE
jgi:hypothetical protein